MWTLSRNLPVAFISIGLCAQSSKELNFEAASVKSIPMSARGRIRMEGGPDSSDPTRITYVNVPVKQLFVVAYGVRLDQITGPEWLEFDQVDISAKIAPGATRQDFHVMLQNLLIERFGVVAHREQKAVSAYQLVVAKNGPKAGLRLSEEAGGGEPVAASDPAIAAKRSPPYRLTRKANGECSLRVSKMGMSLLAGVLEQRLGQQVFDATGLRGSYAFELNWSEDSSAAMAFASPRANGSGSEATIDATASPTIFKALQDQLGLRLESGAKSSINLLVIDHINRMPTPN